MPGGSSSSLDTDRTSGRAQGVLPDRLNRSGFPHSHSTEPAYVNALRHYAGTGAYDRNPSWFAGGRHAKGSKHLSALLRHQAAGLPLDADGGIGFSALAEFMSLHHPQFLCEIVLTNPKQRFEFLDDFTRIRARQGHTNENVLDSVAMRQLTLENNHLFGVQVHGTTKTAWDSIRTSGLVPGGKGGAARRTHVHFATCMPSQADQVLSGLRTNSEIIICLDLNRWLADNHQAFFADNGVLCTPEVVPPMYLSLIHI